MTKCADTRWLAIALLAAALTVAATPRGFAQAVARQPVRADLVGAVGGDLRHQADQALVREQFFRLPPFDALCSDPANHRRDQLSAQLDAFEHRHQVVGSQETAFPAQPQKSQELRGRLP